MKIISTTLLLLFTSTALAQDSSYALRPAAFMPVEERIVHRNHGLTYVLIHLGWDGIAELFKYFGPKISKGKSDSGIPDNIIKEDPFITKLGVEHYAYVMDDSGILTPNPVKYSFKGNIIFNRKSDQSTYDLCNVRYDSSFLQYLEAYTVRSMIDLIIFIARTNPYTETGRVDQWCNYNNALIFLTEMYIGAKHSLGLMIDKEAYKESKESSSSDPMTNTIDISSRMRLDVFEYKCIDGIESKNYSDDHCMLQFREGLIPETQELYVSWNNTLFATPIDGKYSPLPDMIMGYYFSSRAQKEDAAYQEPLPTTVVSIDDGRDFQRFLECDKASCYDAEQFYIR